MKRFLGTHAALMFRVPVLITKVARETRTAIHTPTEVSQTLMKTYWKLWLIMDYLGKG
jgi:hypothetical protein